MSQTPIYDELIAALAEPNAAASPEKPPAARAKSTRTPARPPRTPAADAAADNSAAARKNRRHRAEP